MKEIQKEVVNATLKGEIITIGSTELEIKEFKGQRVITLKDIDRIHNRADGTAKRNFNQNKDRFIECEDYFFVKPKDVVEYEIRTSEINNSGTYLITEQGYLMLVKSFTDDLSWQVQRQLVNNYFAGSLSLKSIFKIMSDFKQEISEKVNELAEQGRRNHRPSHKTKLDLYQIIKERTNCHEDAELIKKAVFNKFDVSKWEDIPYSDESDILAYIIAITGKVKAYEQVTFFDKVQ